jgi:hypothetical protein
MHLFVLVLVCEGTSRGTDNNECCIGFCRYPAETMQLVAHLSQGVADGYREKQKGRLQRTFVQASDAAGAKAKGRT